MGEAVHRAEGAGGGSGDGAGGIAIAPTVATTYLGCRQAAAWVVASVSNGRWKDYPKIKRDKNDVGDLASLTSSKGNDHENAILERLRLAHGEDAVGVVTEGGLDKRPREAQLRATRKAMDRGVPIIHQAALRLDLGDHHWFGYADFLRRVPVPCESWPSHGKGTGWSYEPWDAKLATRP